MMHISPDTNDGDVWRGVSLYDNLFRLLHHDGAITEGIDFNIVSYTWE